ncbi:MAG: HTH domain-containing protein [Pirellulaceae bacterium]|nr:HTH domain-containing protein [Pirellulaceae bacterium]
MARTQRAILILRLLQAGQPWSADELAGQFQCSTRTIFRDMQLLKDCGIAVERTADRGFHLKHDFFWRPERLARDEMIALVVASKLGTELLPPNIAQNLAAAVTKLVGSEQQETRERLANLRIDAPHNGHAVPLPHCDFFPLLLDQITEQRPTRVLLAAGAESAPRELVALPTSLGLVGEAWHLTLMFDEGKEESVPLTMIAGVEGAAGEVEV